MKKQEMLQGAIACLKNENQPKNCKDFDEIFSHDFTTQPKLAGIGVRVPEGLTFTNCVFHFQFIDARRQLWQE
jgi:hypothetical protein